MVVPDSFSGCFFPVFLIRLIFILVSQVLGNMIDRYVRNFFIFHSRMSRGKMEICKLRIQYEIGKFSSHSLSLALEISSAPYLVLLEGGMCVVGF